jgi:hypothetical protein
MSEQVERDLKMIETYEAVVEFYEAHEHQELSNYYGWPLEVYDRLDEAELENEELKEKIRELQEYIEDNQVSDSEEHLGNYYDSLF